MKAQCGRAICKTVDDSRPTSLASGCFKVFGANGPLQDCSPLRHSQGCVRWGADVMASCTCVPPPTRLLRSWTITKRSTPLGWKLRWDMFSVEVSGRMWALIAHFVQGAFSQVRTGSDLSEFWRDSGIAQGRVLSPLLFIILVNGPAQAVHDANPSVSLMANWDSRFAGQLCADDLVIVADSAAHLRTSWTQILAMGVGHKFTFGGGSAQSAAHYFWPNAETSLRAT